MQRAPALPCWKYSLSTYKIHKGFIIVHNYSDQNCDTSFKIKKG